MSRRQLTLPGVKERTPPGPPAPRASRDLTAMQFRDALVRNGFVQVNAVQFADVGDPSALPRPWGGQPRFPGVIECVHRVNPIRIARRATLAKLLRSRKGTSS